MNKADAYYYGWDNFNPKVDPKDLADNAEIQFDIKNPIVLFDVRQMIHKGFTDRLKQERGK